MPYSIGKVVQSKHSNLKFCVDFKNQIKKGVTAMVFEENGLFWRYVQFYLISEIPILKACQIGMTNGSSLKFYKPIYQCYFCTLYKFHGDPSKIVFLGGFHACSVALKKNCSRKSIFWAKRGLFDMP